MHGYFGIDYCIQTQTHCDLGAYFTHFREKQEWTKPPSCRKTTQRVDPQNLANHY